MTTHTMSARWTDIPSTEAVDHEPSGPEPETASRTPAAGDVHEVPADLLETLDECWTRCRMAGLERAKGERWGRRVGLASTVITTAAGTAVWTTLQGQTDLASQWIVGIIGAVVAVAVAIEHVITTRYHDDAVLMDGLVKTFHSAHVGLLSAASVCRLTGAAPEPGAVDAAKKTVADHVASMPHERPTFGAARASVVEDMKALGFYR